MIKRIIIICLSLQVYCPAYSQNKTTIVEQGTYLIHRRLFLIGEESYTIKKSDDLLVVNSNSKELERSTTSIAKCELRSKADFTPVYYELSRETSNTLQKPPKDLSIKIENGEATIIEGGATRKMSVTSPFFTVHALMPVTMEMILIRYWLHHKLKGTLPVLPAGEVSIKYHGKDLVEIKGKKVSLDRYIVNGITWGIQTVWMNASGQLVAVVRAGTTPQQIILKGFEDAFSFFVSKSGEEQMVLLNQFTKSFRQKQPEIVALVGGNLIDGTGAAIQKDVTIFIKRDRIISINFRSKSIIPKGAKVIDVTGKTLTAGLWDMHAHASQVEFSPAYLAGGVTTIRDPGNQIQFSTAYRDAVNSGSKMGPEMLLAGLVDGAGPGGNGIIRATTPEEAREVVRMYKSKGYLQMKIYNSLKPELVKVIADEAHKLGMTVTGHVPRGISTIEAIENGMDQINHSSFGLMAMLPNAREIKFGKGFSRVNEADLESDDVKKGIECFVKNRTVLDATISLYELENHLENIPFEKVDPAVLKMPVELYEIKFQKGLSGKLYDTAKIAMDKALVLLGMLHKAGVPIVAGTDNGIPVHNLYLELELYVKGGFTPLEAIQAATIVPAKAMKRDMETGTIEVGKRADIAIYDANPLENISNIRSVTAVVSRGYYFKSAPLWKSVGFKP